MEGCKDLIHPFQNDPGVSQRQRIMNDLLSGPAQIDGRQLADLLDYFTQLSRHINYYHPDLSVSDWQPFFQKSIPFSLAAISKFKQEAVTEKLGIYQKLFRKNAAPSGLQLLVHYVYYSLIHNINTWHLLVKGSELPVAFALETLIPDKLRPAVKAFISYANAAVKWYCIKPVNWQPLAENEIWDLDVADLYTSDVSFKNKDNTSTERISALYQSIYELIPAFLDVTRIVAGEAAQSIEQSLEPLKEELQKNHPPHLALLFTFLKLFRYLQNDLNGFTRKHLDFFYKQVLQLKAREATPDKTHLVFEIQNQLDNYLLRKGLLAKDGKDNNKAEVFFALDNEIVVNKTQIANLRTLFLHHQTYSTTTYLEGVYMAPNASKADGVEKDFKVDVPGSFATLGAKNSKYKDPELNYVKPYPNARLGFILASPVLLLKEGKRIVTITLTCKLDNPCQQSKIGALYSPSALFNRVRYLAGKIYHYVSQDQIREAIKKGIEPEKLATLWCFLEKDRNPWDCNENAIVEELKYCEKQDSKYLQHRIVTARVWRNIFLNNPNSLTESEKAIISKIFKPRRILKVHFSGKDEWLEPSHLKKIKISAITGNEFTIKIKAVLKADKGAVTFYDKEKLQEDITVSQPVVKFELDDDIKILRGINLSSRSCCLEKSVGNSKKPVSFYHFFRNVKIQKTQIDVSVCGLKNLIIQNDESLQDVNGLMYPFGTRPKINANFYVGTEEIFLKKWSDIFININWKDIPSFSPPPPDPLNRKPFQYYYIGYQDFLFNSGVETNVVEDNKFRVQIAVLQDGAWKQWKYDENCSGPGDLKCQLFQKMPAISHCNTDKEYAHQFRINRNADYPAPGLPFPAEELYYKGIKQFDVNARQNFLRLTLKCQDFQHDRYPFVLARQMTALGKLPQIVDGAVYYGVTLGGPLPQFVTLEMPQILQQIITNYNISLNPNLLTNLEGLINEINNLANPPLNINPAVWNKLFVNDDPSTPFPNDAPPFSSAPVANPAETHSDYYVTLKAILDWLKDLKEKIEKFKDKGVVIPNEPWTPVIKEIALNYTATATATDIALIHLYPYKDTYKHEEISLTPTLFPVLCDEGTLFLGLQQLVPGSNLNLLFQLAEATADSEAEKENVTWAYLDNNQWKALRPGFEVLDDATDGLTTSGIVKLALPANMTSDNTILPAGLHWIKAAIPQNSCSVSETIGLHTQAVQVTFTNEQENDKLRLAAPLPAGSVAKLKEADVAVSKVLQPYDSYGGRIQEAEGHYYVRVSEQLRHKNRAIQKFDYERLALEAFPQLYKVKCINHSFALNANVYANDFPVAPGYVLLAVIPDLNQLKAAQTFEPRVPVSLLEKIRVFLLQHTSPFVRLRIMNPRYEKIHFCLKIKLYPGKDENFYNDQLKQDLSEFLAPWAVGQYDKLSFGQCIYRSDVVRFLKTRHYLNYILELIYWHEADPKPDKNDPDYEKILLRPVCPKTPRSILISGDIDVCIQQQDCPEWQQREPCSHAKIPMADYCNETD